VSYPWLLFDADETLFDFSAAEANALRWTLEQARLPWKAEFLPLYAQLNAQVWREFERGEIDQRELRTKRFVLFLEAAGLEADPYRINPLYIQNLARGTGLIDGAHEVVHELKTRHRLALVTNGLAEVQRPRLENSSLRGCFEHVFISEEMGAAKPSAAYFEAVFEAIGQPAREQVLIIGDSLSSDMRGGLDFGIATCWYNPGGKSTDLPVTHKIARLGELVELVG
jgi:2-haloacid dehalogenase